jgi:hypothetical protein
VSGFGDAHERAEARVRDFEHGCFAAIDALREDGYRGEGIAILLRLLRMPYVCSCGARFAFVGEYERHLIASCRDVGRDG